MQLIISSNKCSKLTKPSWLLVAAISRIIAAADDDVTYDVTGQQQTTVENNHVYHHHRRRCRHRHYTKRDVVVQCYADNAL